MLPGCGKPEAPCEARAATKATVNSADTDVRIGVKLTAPHTITANGSAVSPSANWRLALMPQAMTRKLATRLMLHRLAPPENAERARPSRPPRQRPAPGTDA